MQLALSLVWIKKQSKLILKWVLKIEIMVPTSILWGRISENLGPDTSVLNNDVEAEFRTILKPTFRQWLCLREEHLYRLTAGYAACFV